jgi:hypothetical protein
MAHLTLPYLSDYKKIIGKEQAQKYTHDVVNSNTGSSFFTLDARTIRAPYLACTNQTIFDFVTSI